MMKSAFKRFIFLPVVSIVLLGCGPNKRIIESGRENPPLDRPNANMERPVRSFETDLEAMRTADFGYIYVLRRMDGGSMDADDKRFLSANIPADANRRELSDEGRALLVGTNFPIPDNMLVILKERFNVTDHSQPGNRQNGANANALR